ncbi:hypothetical protein JW921_01900 [Candidatus Fermentibacterales bacterium]|nr:hypothetical protein [Candidatus Fermentibacterales bacterium]
MLSSRPPGFWVFLSIVGLVTGTVLGEAIGAILPETSASLRVFFSGSVDVSIGPLSFDLVVFRFSLEEIGLRFNLMSFVGLVIVGYLYRWF